MSAVGKLKQGLAPFLEKPVLANVLIGMASGFPYTMVMSTLTFWLSDIGIDRISVGVFALAGLPWGLKFLWSPFLDRMNLGVITRKFGHRRGWLLTIYFLIFLCMIGLVNTNPLENIMLTSSFAITLSFLSASHDVVIDAYRIEIMEKHQYAHGATTYTLGYRLAFLVTGYIALMLADDLGWSVSLMIPTIFILAGVVALIWVGEPEVNNHDFIEAEKENIDRYGKFYEMVVLPFKEIMSRNMWWVLLIFILTFKIGDAMVTVMVPPLLNELNYSNEDIANANKLVSGFALWGGIIAGSFLYSILGLYRSLMITIVCMGLTNLMYVWLVNGSHDFWSLAITSGVENFFSSLGNVAIIVFFSRLVNKEFTATQYAMFSAFATLGGKTVGSLGGYISMATDWSIFFTGTALIAIPSSLLCIYLNKRGILSFESTSTSKTEPFDN